MKRIIWLLAFLTLAPAYAADNVAVTPGSGKTIACLDISTVCFAKYIPYDITGAAFGVTGNPFFVTSTTLATAVNQATVTTWAGGTLGAMANYGTSPGAVLVPGANVFVTGSTGLAIGSTTFGQTLSLTGCASTTYSPTATTADTWPFSCDPAGNVRIVPQASSGKVSGTNSQTSTTTTSLITAVTSERIYVQAISCSNTGATTSLVLFQDGSGGTTLWQAIVPSGGGTNLASAAPMFWTTAGNALYFAPQSASTTVYCNASGYAGN